MKTVTGPRSGELIFSLVLLAFGLWAFWQSFGISGFDSISGPGVFPMLASGLMVLSGACILAKLVGRMRGAEPAETPLLRYVFPLRFLVFVPMMTAFVVAMPWIGFYPASAAFLFASIAFLWRRGIVRSALVTVISVTAIYLVFRVVFRVVLPSGTLWQ